MSFAQVAYSNSKPVLMYESAGSICQLAPVVPIRNVSVCGAFGEAGTELAVANAIAARHRNTSGLSLRGSSARRCTHLLCLTSATDHKCVL